MAEVKGVILNAQSLFLKDRYSEAELQQARRRSRRTTSRCSSRDTSTRRGIRTSRWWRCAG